MSIASGVGRRTGVAVSSSPVVCTRRRVSLGVIHFPVTAHAHVRQNGITLRQLAERTRSLERAFFALTGPGSADVPDGQEMGAIR